MSRALYEIFEDEAEQVEFFEEKSELFELRLTEEHEGLLAIDGIAARLCRGRCLFDLKLIGSGTFTPMLTLKNRIIKLPPIQKNGMSVVSAACTDGYIKGLSLRERRLEKRVEELEKRLSEVLSRIDTTIIF